MSHSSDRHGHGHAHTATNGASLEDCHANFFALVSTASGPPGRPLGSAAGLMPLASVSPMCSFPGAEAAGAVKFNGSGIGIPESEFRLFHK